MKVDRRLINIIMCQVIYFISSNILIDTSNLVYDIIDVYDLFTILFNCNLI